MHSSSPTVRPCLSRQQRSSSTTQSITNSSSLFLVSQKRNLRIMNINCRSVCGSKSSELKAALHYIKPDIVCGTESWLKGFKPGKPTATDAIQSSEVFPAHYKAYKNDRGTLGVEYSFLSMKTLSLKRKRNKSPTARLNGSKSS
ncbi:hypothetical protein DPMN_143782 [Dreissena polymorpha]|uniref:Endonuclease/exonuclease/phosphatase domain-containing protein n=1 Tax=Dreissena polymorpha TaxID=45954 RepID=A0A9D4GDR8_DREPO|nr:hypothetical protein DPMN_143782 [Dreissena polymorpha]